MQTNILHIINMWLKKKYLAGNEQYSVQAKMKPQLMTNLLNVGLNKE